MTYKEINPDFGQPYIEWDDDGVIRFIPVDPANSDYQKYLQWKTDQEESAK